MVLEIKDIRAIDGTQFFCKVVHLLAIGRGGGVELEFLNCHGWMGVWWGGETRVDGIRTLLVSYSWAFMDKGHVWRWSPHRP